jgi:hypothetical protein
MAAMQKFEFNFQFDRDNLWTIWARKMKYGLYIDYKYAYKLCKKYCV